MASPVDGSIAGTAADRTVSVRLGSDLGSVVAVAWSSG